MQMQSQDIEHDEGTAEDQQAELLQILGSKLLAQAEEQVRNKSQLEQRWLQDLRQVHGVLTAEEERKLREANKSQVVVNITRNKANAAEARLADLAAPTDSRHWGINPTPVPELEEAMLSEEITQMPDGQQMPVKELAKRKIAIARDKAQKMEQVIDDQTTEAGLNGKIRAIIHDAVRLGTGILKGPIVVGRSRRSWEAIDPESGVYALTYKQDFRPGIEVVSPWNFFPDMRACTMEEAEFTFERKFLTKQMLRDLAKRPGYLVDQIKELLGEDPKALSVSDTYTDEIRTISGIDNTADDNRYELWEYHGEVSKDDLQAAGCEMEDNDLEACHGVVEFCGTRVIRVMLSPMESGDKIYSALNWETDNASIFGYGVPYLMRHSQKVINASWRMLMDNAGLCVGGQIVLDRDKITPADGRWELSPRKVWWYSDPRKQGSVRDAFGLHEISSHQAELQAIFTMARQLADEETNLPLIAQGEQAGHITDTAKGMSILMASADVVLRKVVKLIDDHVYKPIITRFYDWNMQFNPDDSIKGDFEVDARGSDALLEDAAREQGLLDTAQLVNDPTYGKFMKPREMLVQIIKGKKLSPDEMLKSEAEMQEEAEKAAQQGPPIDPVKKAEIEIKQKELQHKIQREQIEIQNRTKREQIELQLKQQEMALKREIEMSKLALEKQITLEKLYSNLGIEKEKIHTQRQIEGVKAINMQDEMELRRRTGAGI